MTKRKKIKKRGIEFLEPEVPSIYEKLSEKVEEAILPEEDASKKDKKLTKQQKARGIEERIEAVPYVPEEEEVADEEEAPVEESVMKKQDSDAEPDRGTDMRLRMPGAPVLETPPAPSTYGSMRAKLEAKAEKTGMDEAEIKDVLAAAKDEYDKVKDDIKDRESKEAIINGIMKMALGFIGLNSLNKGGEIGLNFKDVKFDKTDWDAKFNRAYREYQAKVSNIQSEIQRRAQKDRDKFSRESTMARMDTEEYRAHRQHILDKNNLKIQKYQMDMAKFRARQKAAEKGLPDKDRQKIRDKAAAKLTAGDISKMPKEITEDQWYMTKTRMAMMAEQAGIPRSLVDQRIAKSIAIPEGWFQNWEDAEPIKDFYDWIRVKTDVWNKGAVKVLLPNGQEAIRPRSNPGKGVKILGIYND